MTRALGLTLSAAIALLLTCNENVWAQTGDKSYGFRVDGGIGQPNSSIQNPDGTFAYYNGIVLQGRLIAPVWATSTVSASLSGGIRYLDLKNTASEKAETEIANHIGPMGGLRVGLGKFFAGADYVYMLARHYTVGTISRSIEYSYTPLSYYGGITFPLGQLAFGFSYTVTSGTIPASGTKLSKDSPYADTLVLLHLTWNSGSETTQFVGNLFK